MKRTPGAITIAVWFSVFSSLSLFSAEKSTFDLREHSSSPLAKSASMPGTRFILTGPISEASMIEGAYYTLGTTSGLSQSALDDKCTITYGHPYAKTSYPLVCLDGVWAKPESVFPAQASYPQRAGDSLTLVYTRAGTIEMRFVIRLEAGDGGIIHIASSLKNIDTVSHTLGLGLAFDPSLGKGGDCSIKLGAAAIARDTMLASASLHANALTLTERSSMIGGMKIGISFPSSTPQSLIIGNWNSMYDNDTPQFAQSDVRTLYDALIKLFWTTKSVPPQSSITEEAVVTLQSPNFGQGVFCRWDVPETQSVENGIPFPKQFTSTVTLSNTTTGSKSRVDLVLSLPAEVQAPNAAMATAVNAQSSAYLACPLTVKELFENKVVSLVAVCKENGAIVDSLIVPFRICAAPVSDTGLVVTIDSVLTSSYPKMCVSFDVQKKSPQQYIFGLDASNVFLYENGARISDLTLGKDTTGGGGSVDIVFVLDVTGSMSGSITGVKNNIMEFADSLAGRGIDYRLGMVTFLDAVEAVFDFTASASAFKTSVAAQYAHGGGDIPENSLDALYRASEMSFRPAARKIFIWITDANYHEMNANTARTKQSVIQRLLSLDVTVHAIGASAFQTDWYKPITEATGGKYYDIYGNFRDILLDIGNLRGSNRYLISYTSPLPAAAASKEIRLTIHYAGYGGTASVLYTTPSSSVAARSLSCFPNPFNPQTTIRMTIPPETHAALVIYNLLGQEVRRYRLTGTAGVTEIVWNAHDAQGGDAASGIYFVRFTLLSASDQTLRSEIAKILYLQ